MGDKELVDEIPFGAHHLDPVIACLAGAGSSGDDVADLLLDPVFVQFFGRERRDRGFDRRGANTIGRIGVAACMQDLHGDLATCIMDTICHSPVVGDVFIRVKAGRPREHTALWVRGHSTRDHQRHIAACALGVKFGNAVPILGFFQPRVHRAHQHAVLERGKPQIERGQKIGVLGHDMPPLVPQSWRKLPCASPST